MCSGSGPSARTGDRRLAGGILTGTLLAYVFQLVGGRLLGPEAFAPVSVLWTLMFLTGTVGLLTPDLTTVVVIPTAVAVAVGTASSPGLVAAQRGQPKRPLT